MIINRYYSQQNNYKVKLRYLDNYKNWSLTNYVDTTNITLLAYNNRATFPEILHKGNAKLYSLAPVVKHGGDLIADETTQAGETLHEDMTITNNATLIVNGDYYANANIKLKDGGKIISGQNGKIIFSSGKRLIIEGNSEIKGSENNRLNFVFSNSRSGIRIISQGSLNISYCDIEGGDLAIQSNTNQRVKISNVTVNGSAYSGIFITSGQEQDNTPIIENSLISNCPTGITITGTDEIVIKGNEIKQCNNGIMMINVNSGYVRGNQIDGENNLAGVGIYLQNTGGYLRDNVIRRHATGIHLSYSSPDIGANTIEHNRDYGIYVGVGSIPDLRKRLVNPNCWYPISGCNTIRENGIGDPTNNINIEAIGSEIYLEKSDIRINYGENEISDDREYVPTHLTILLITGRLSNDGNLEAEGNYWGVVGANSGRFGELQVIYEPLGEYCLLPYMPCNGGNDIVIQTTDGKIIDTIETKQRLSALTNPLEELYSLADKLYYSGQLEEAKEVYSQLTNGGYTNREKVYAYKKLYDIGEIMKKEEEYFTALQNQFNGIITNETDTLVLKALRQREILCDVSKREYITAIEKLEGILNQNPYSREAIYAEIDIMTLIQYIDSTGNPLGKASKYKIKGTTEYMDRLNQIVGKNFGGKLEKGEHIPDRYVLHHNYPNPFNPNTIISWRSPVGSHTTLKIYDVLGREVATLVDEYKEAGYHSVSVSSSQLLLGNSIASGVYFYRLQAGEFVQTKKMMLLK
jgi:tetratricopeptide (TPR) repeat protein